MAVSIEAHCMKCKQSSEMKSAVGILMKNGRPAAKGVCAYCGTIMFKIMGISHLEIEFEKETCPKSLIEACEDIQKETVRYLAYHSWELYSVPPDFFEKLMAEILASFGFQVHLNVRLLGPNSGDEADIIATTQIPGLNKKVGYVVECKRFAKHRKVDLQIATRLYGLKAIHAKDWGLDKAILATTSTVTGQVRKEYGDRWDFETKEHDQVVDWLKEYSNSESGLYLRKQGLTRPAAELVFGSLSIPKKPEN